MAPPSNFECGERPAGVANESATPDQRQRQGEIWREPTSARREQDKVAFEKTARGYLKRNSNIFLPGSKPGPAEAFSVKEEPAPVTLAGFM